MGFPDLDLSFLFCPFLGLPRFFLDFPDLLGEGPGILPICSGRVRGFSRFVLFLFLGLLRAPTRNSPERVRDTIWTFPEKSGKHPGLETPRFSFSQQKKSCEVSAANSFASDCDRFANEISIMTTIPESEIQVKFFADTGEKRGGGKRNILQIFVLEFPGKVAARNFTKNPPHFPRGTKQNSLRIFSGYF